MSIKPELEAQILRLYHVEKWRCGTIARQLHLHRDTVRRVLAQAGLPRHGKPRPAMIAAYLPFILATLERYPKLTASRLHAMVRERGYPGSPSHFRHQLALYRPRPLTEAFLRLRTLAGEQGQVDWGHFGHLQIGRARRPLMAFVLVLSYSRALYLRFFLDARLENFLRGHVGAFEHWQALPRVLLYDNLKSAVLERQGDAIRFHPTLLALASHYRFEPRPVAVARGNEKGRVERAIRYVREAFFIARRFADLDDLNAQALRWCEEVAGARPWPQDPVLTVGAALAQERPNLLTLPVTPFPTEEVLVVKSGKTPYVRFDLNDYSIPHTHVRRALQLRATPDQVRVLDGAQLLAAHARSYDKGAVVEQTEHIAALLAEKRAAHAHRAVHSLTAAAPACADLLTQAGQRGEPLGALTRALTRLLERYGAGELEAAVGEALAHGVPHTHAVRQALERRREQRGLPPPVALVLPDHVRARDANVRAARLDDYDRAPTKEE